MKPFRFLSSAPCLVRALLWVVPLVGVYFVFGVFNEVQGALAASVRLAVPVVAGSLIALAVLFDFLFRLFLSKASGLRLVRALHGCILVVALGFVGNELYLQSTEAAGASWAHMDAKTEPAQFKGPLAFDKKLGWIGKPDYSGKRRITGSERRVDFVCNAGGYRDIDFTGRDKRPLLIVIGDSLAAAIDVDMEHGIVARLRHYLPEYQVVNLAVTAYGLDQIYLKLKMLDLRHEPAVVLCMMHWEVGGDRSRPAEYGRLKPFFEANGKELVLRNEQVRQATSNLEIQRALAPAEYERISNLAMATAYFCREYFPNRVKSLSQFKRFPQRPRAPTPVSRLLLQEIERLSRQAGAEMHFAFVPGKANFKNDVTREMKSVEETLDSLGLLHLDGYSALLPEGPSLFTTGGHLNREGNDRAARGFALQLQQGKRKAEMAHDSKTPNL